MAKATKRKVIRARGNNLKKTVRRGRKLNRAVNHVKATKKRRKSRSRRTSRKVRNNLNLDQSGGKAGTHTNILLHFYKKYKIDPVELENFLLKYGINVFYWKHEGKSYLYLKHSSKIEGLKFKYHYTPLVFCKEPFIKMYDVDYEADGTNFKETSSSYIGNLPDTLEEFKELLRETFGVSEIALKAEGFVDTSKSPPPPGFEARTGSDGIRMFVPLETLEEKCIDIDLAEFYGFLENLDSFKDKKTDFGLKTNINKEHIYEHISGEDKIIQLNKDEITNDSFNTIKKQKNHSLEDGDYFLFYDTNEELPGIKMAVFKTPTPTIIDLDAEVSQYFKTKEFVGKALGVTKSGKPYVETASGDTYAMPIKITQRDGDGYEVPQILIQPDATV
tara:strand:+ start:400 stop:1566 length:1167 start_codon:yes stop_codon:yes gene_type:complete